MNSVFMTVKEESLSIGLLVELLWALGSLNTICLKDEAINWLIDSMWKIMLRFIHNLKKN